MRPEDLAVLPEKMEKLIYQLQDRIMSDVVRRIRKTGEITSTADYQLVKTQWLGQSTEYIETQIKELTGKTWPEMFELYDKVIEQDYTRYAALYEQVNSTFLPFEKNTLLQNWTQAVIDQTHEEITNITQSLGFAVNYGNGRTEYWPLSRYYQKYLDDACMDIVTGSFDYNTVLKRTVKQMSDSGIRDVRFPSGRCERAPVAVRRAVMTGVNQLSAKLNEYVGKQLGADHYEVTAHIGARPDHAVWQGQVYTEEELGSVCGLGTVEGLCGANCRHNYMPFIPGVSTRAYTDEELEAIREEDEKERTYDGQTYTYYEASQKQRQMEATMRAQRENIKLLKEGRADPEAIQAAQTRYLNTLHQYQSFSNAVEIKPQMERVYVDGLGRMSGGRIPEMIAAMSTKHVYKGNSWPKYGTRITTEQFENLKAHVSNKGFKLMNFESFDGDPELVKDIVDRIALVAEEYPKIIDLNNPIMLHANYSLGDDTYAMIKNNNLYLNGYAFRNREALAADYKAAVSAGIFPKGTSYQSIGDHEAAHLIQRAYKIDVNNLRFKAVPGVGMVECSNTIYEQLSEYALKNNGELFAEAFSAYKSGRRDEIVLNVLTACGII